MSHIRLYYPYWLLSKTIWRSASKTTVNQNETLKKCSSNPLEGKKRETEDWEPEERNGKQIIIW